MLNANGDGGKLYFMATADCIIAVRRIENRIPNRDGPLPVSREAVHGGE